MEEADENYADSKARGFGTNRLPVKWVVVVYYVQYFFLSGAEQVDRVFLKPMLQEGGMTATQTGVIAGLGPLVGCLVTFIVASVTDRYSKVVLVLASAGAAAVACYTTVIPVLPLPHQITNFTILGMLTNTSTKEVSELYEETWDFFFPANLLANMGFWVFRLLTLNFTDVSLISFLSESGMDKYPDPKSSGSLGAISL